MKTTPKGRRLKVCAKTQQGRHEEGVPGFRSGEGLARKGVDGAIACDSLALSGMLLLPIGVDTLLRSLYDLYKRVVVD